MRWKLFDPRFIRRACYREAVAANSRQFKIINDMHTRTTIAFSKYIDKTEKAHEQNKKMQAILSDLIRADNLTKEQKAAIGRSLR